MKATTDAAPGHEIAESLLAEFEQELRTTRRFFQSACLKIALRGGRMRNQ